MTGRAARASRDAPSLLPDRRLALLLIACFAVLWAIVEDELGARLQYPYDLRQVVWCRYASHLVVVALVWGWRAPKTFWRTARLPLQLGRSLLMLVMPMSFMYAAMAGVSLSTVWAVFWTAPLMILVGARVYGGEQASFGVWIVTTVAVVAATVIIHPSALPAPRVLVLSLIMAASFAYYVVLTRELRHEQLSANLFYTAAGVIIPLSLLMRGAWHAPTPHDAMILFGIGALGFVALLALDRAAERTGLSWTAAALTLQVVVAQCIRGTRDVSALPASFAVGTVVIVVCVAALWITAPRSTAAVHA